MRYIDADKMLENFKRLHGKRLHGEEDDLLNCYNADWIISFIEGQPLADVQEVRHGKWEKANSLQDYYRCSVCYAVWDRAFEYCPHCGAKMDKVRD